MNHSHTRKPPRRRRGPRPGFAIAVDSDPRYVTVATWKAVVQRDGGQCKLCGRKLTRKEITMDHIIPVSRGGRSTFENLRVACGPCNHGRPVDSET